MVAPPFEWKDFEARDVIDFIFGYSMFLYTDICILINMSIYSVRYVPNIHWIQMILLKFI